LQEGQEGRSGQPWKGSQGTGLKVDDQTPGTYWGCRPGTVIPLDTHRLHYSELTVKGAYHHRPATFQSALDLLAGGAVQTGELLSAERPLEELEDALRSMMRKEALKVVIRP
jgi:L-iditol 2-dehydrogenase